jgi:TrpR-related protein YerC/YecD
MLKKNSESKDLQELFKAVAGLKTKDECVQFFTDLCTPAELSAMADRWKAARLLTEGFSYREIYEKSGVSTATVTRVARCLTFGAGGYRLVLNRAGKDA